MADSVNDTPNSPAELETALLALLNDEISLDPSVLVESDTDLLTTGLVDSLGVVQIVTWAEDEYGVTIDPIDVTIDNFRTPDRMVAFIGGLARS